MISYEELIYAFTDIYLQTAVECSVCIENYEMADEEEFLEEYMKLFLSLLQAVENDSKMELKALKDRLEQERGKCLKHYHSFLEDRIMENALEHAAKEKSSLIGQNVDIFVKKIQEYYNTVFTDKFEAVKESPIQALEYIRDIEERLQG